MNCHLEIEAVDQTRIHFLNVCEVSPMSGSLPYKMYNQVASPMNMSKIHLNITLTGYHTHTHTHTQNHTNKQTSRKIIVQKLI